MLDLLVDLLGRPAGIGFLAGQAFVEDYAQGIEVGIKPHLHTLELLRRHVIGAANKTLLVLQAALEAVVQLGVGDHRGRDAEVQYPGKFFLTDDLDHDIGGLEIAVDDPGVVGDLESGQESAGDPQGPPDAQRPFLLDELAQRLAVDVVHRVVEQAFAFFRVALGDSHISDLDDVGIDHLHRHANFVQELLAKHFVLAEFRRQYLHRQAVTYDARGHLDHEDAAESSLSKDLEDLVLAGHNGTDELEIAAFIPLQTGFVGGFRGGQRLPRGLLRKGKVSGRICTTTLVLQDPRPWK